MSELTDHLGLPADCAASSLRDAAAAFLSGDSTAIPNPKRARLILAARRATGETFKARTADPDVKRALETIAALPDGTNEFDRLREANEKLRQATGPGLPCRPPCKGIGRLHDVAPEGWAVTCPKCSRIVPGRSAGEAVRAWETE